VLETLQISIFTSQLKGSIHRGHQEILHPPFIATLATMHSMEKFQPPLRAPKFPSGYWINTIEPIMLEENFGNVTLIEIFDYTCINCIRTLPYLRSWYERYEPFGLSLVGIHTPEFSFAHDPEVVEAGIHRLGIHWPVILDNDQSLWTAYANRYWPSLYFIDHNGKIRYRHVGEGSYAESESMIQELLLEKDQDLQLPDLMQPLRPEDAQGAYCSPTSPELHIGSIEKIELDTPDPTNFELPNSLQKDQIHLQGTWRVTRDGIMLNKHTGEITLQYEAAKVYALLAPTPDDDQRLPFQDEPLYIQVLQDDEPLDRLRFGKDILADGLNARFRVDFPRLYDLVENPSVESHELRLIINRPGLTFYAFSFGSCISEEDSPPSRIKE
jgi:hypothetical protein